MLHIPPFLQYEFLNKLAASRPDYLSQIITRKNDLDEVLNAVDNNEDKSYCKTLMTKNWILQILIRSLHPILRQLIASKSFWFIISFRKIFSLALFVTAIIHFLETTLFKNFHIYRMIFNA